MAKLLTRKVAAIGPRINYSNCFRTVVGWNSQHVSQRGLYLTPTVDKRVYGPPEDRSTKTHHWQMERVVAVALLPAIPAALMFPNIVTDTVLAAALVMHTHWGLSGVATDYIHGEVLPKIFQPTILLLSILAFGGLCYLNYADVGFGRAVQLLYSQL